MIELTLDQHRALAQFGSEPARAVDRATQAEYVLVPSQVYDRIKQPIIADTDWHRGAYPAAMEVFARDGWDDPRMDDYDALDPRPLMP